MSQFSESFTRTDDHTGTRSRKWERSGITPSIPLPQQVNDSVQVPPIIYPQFGETMTVEIPIPQPIDQRIEIDKNIAVIPHGVPIDLVSLLSSGIRVIYVKGERGLPGIDGEHGKEGKGIKGDQGTQGDPGIQGSKGPPCDCKNILYGKRRPTRIIRGRGNRTIDVLDEYIVLDSNEPITLYLPDLSKMSEPDDYDDFYLESKVYNVMCYNGSHCIKTSTPNSKINGYLTEYRMGSTVSTNGKGFVSTAKVISTDNGGWVIV